MKKLISKLPYLSLLVGVLIATGSHGTFTKKQVIADPDGMYTFENVTGSSSSSDVTSILNWHPTNVTDPCDNVPQRACKLRVQGAFVDSSVSPIRLKNTINISAALASSSGTYYVASTADGSAQISNQSD